ncbi:MAG: hypothetical protein R3236_07060 [Phycisphaeraceae bacterium]|nr:hypothetical protein [Phycisphaeraceae bacterium]
MLHRLFLLAFIAWTAASAKTVVAGSFEPSDFQIHPPLTTHDVSSGQNRYGFQVPEVTATEPMRHPQADTYIAMLGSDDETAEVEDADKHATDAVGEENQSLPATAPQPALFTGGHIQGGVGTGRNDTPEAGGLHEPKYFGTDVALELDDGPWSLVFAYGNQRDRKLESSPFFRITTLKIDSYLLGARYTQKVALSEEEEECSFYLYGQGGIGYFDAERVESAPSSVTISESRDFDFWVGAGGYIPLNDVLTVGLDCKYHFTEAKFPTGTLDTEGFVCAITIGVAF